MTKEIKTISVDTSMDNLQRQFDTLSRQIEMQLDNVDISDEDKEKATKNIADVILSSWHMSETFATKWTSTWFKEEDFPL